MTTTLITRDNELYLRTKTLEKTTEYLVLKGWESATGWYWFATELSDTGYHFGFVQGMYDEWGYFQEQEINSIPTCWEIKNDNLAISGRRD